MKLQSILPQTTLGLLLLTTALQAGQSTGGEFSLTGTSVAGGGQSAGGDLHLSGTAGHPAGTSGGGTFQLSGGLIGIYVVPGEVELTLTRTENGDATLTWSGDAVGYVLQFSSQLDPLADWQPVTPAPTGNTYTTSFVQPARFYRLRKP